MNAKDSPTLFALSKEIFEKGVANNGYRDEFWVTFSRDGYNHACMEKEASNVFDFHKYQQHQPKTVMGFPFKIDQTQEADFVVHTSKQK